MPAEQPVLLSPTWMASREAEMVPTTSSLASGEVLEIPTLPDPFTRRRSSTVLLPVKNRMTDTAPPVRAHGCNVEEPRKPIGTICVVIQHAERRAVTR